MLFYELTCKQTFINQLRALPPAEIPLVREKVDHLVHNPGPDGKNKKRLEHVDGQVFRIRCGDYRVIYTYGSGRVSLLGVGHRSTVYDGGKRFDSRLQAALHATDEPPPLDLRTVPSAVDSPSLDGVQGTASLEIRAASLTDLRSHGSGPRFWSKETEASPVLPRALDDAFLRRIRVVDAAIPKLLRCHTIDDLCAAAVSEEDRSRVFDAVVAPDFDKVLALPDLRLDSVDDLQRLFDGELTTTLLRLDPEQEKLTRWGGATGPTLFRGGPGTGKSVVAIYRVRSLIEQLRRAGVERPCILFTSYTNALVVAAEQLIASLVGPDKRFVEVRTADSVVFDLARRNGAILGFDVDENHTRLHVGRARDRLRNAPATAERLGSIAKLSLPYLVDEIDQVIVGRNIEDEDDYLTAPRAGRRLGLSLDQRRAIWLVHQLREEMTAHHGQRSIAQWRRDALRGLDADWKVAPYDGVVIDEAQDLDTTVIRLLVKLVASPDRLCLTADSNQCIYGNGFRWQDVHQDLKFRGRATILRRSYRSTEQIADAANAYLHGAEGDEEAMDLTHVRVGPTPVALHLQPADDDARILAGYLRDATRTLRVGFSSCAVLVDTKRHGEALAGRLTELGVPSQLMVGKQLDLKRPVVKVTTFQSAKGLEFPVVAIATPTAGAYAPARDAEPEAHEEAALISRRLMYVAMTRAMFALVLLIPANGSLVGDAAFAAPMWQRNRPDSWAEWLGSVSVVAQGVTD